MSETAILVIMSTPLLIIFLMGIYSLVLLLMLDEELEERKKLANLKVDDTDEDLQDLAKKENVIEVLEIEPEDLNQENCVICMSKPRDFAFYPCGHQCLCEDCAQKFRTQARHNLCPICRYRVKDIIRVYK